MPEFIKPKRIRLETSTLCQLKCPCCTTATGEIEEVIGFGYCKYTNFKKLVNDNPFISEIEISNFGEIFLNPELLDIIKYAYEKNIRLSAENGVNLNNVTEEVLEGLVKYKFFRMSCSIDGASNDAYQQYRIKGNFERVIENINKINSYKKTYHSRYPILAWQFIVFGHNEHEIPAAKKQANELGMLFHPKLSWESEFSPVKNPDFVKKETGLIGSTRNEYREKTGKNYAIAVCHQLWEDPQINWDGKILGCCWNFWKDFGGNAFNDGLVNCLNSEKISYAREILSGKKDMRNDLPCTTCDLYKDLKSSGKWLKRGLDRKVYCAAKYIYKRLSLHRWFY